MAAHDAESYARGIRHSGRRKGLIYAARNEESIMSKNRVLGAPLEIAIVTKNTQTAYPTDVYGVEASLGHPVTITLDPGAIEGDQYLVQDVAGNAAGQPITVHAAVGIVGVVGDFQIAQNGAQAAFTFSHALGGWIAGFISSSPSGNFWAEGGNAFGAPGVLAVTDANPLSVTTIAGQPLNIFAGGVNPAVAANGSVNIDAQATIHIAATDATSVVIGGNSVNTAITLAAGVLATPAAGECIVDAATFVVLGHSATGVTIGNAGGGTNVVVNGGTASPGSGISLGTIGAGTDITATAVRNMSIDGVRTFVGPTLATSIAVGGANSTVGIGIGAACAPTLSANGLNMDAAASVLIGNQNATAISNGNAAHTAQYAFGGTAAITSATIGASGAAANTPAAPQEYWVVTFRGASRKIPLYLP